MRPSQLGCYRYHDGSAVDYWHLVLGHRISPCSCSVKRCSCSQSNWENHGKCFFDHDRPDVHRLSIEYVASTWDRSRWLERLPRLADVPWLRVAQSIPLHIADVTRKPRRKDRARFLDHARGSPLGCAAVRDLLVVSSSLESGNKSRTQIKTGVNCRHVDSDCDEIRRCVRIIARAQSFRRARPRRSTRIKRCRRRRRSVVFDLR
jgi:hypothetical protein